MNEEEYKAIQRAKSYYDDQSSYDYNNNDLTKIADNHFESVLAAIFNKQTLPLLPTVILPIHYKRSKVYTLLLTQIDEWLALEEKVTKGPWTTSYEIIWHHEFLKGLVDPEKRAGPHELASTALGGYANARFIATSRNILRSVLLALKDEIEWMEFIAQDGRRKNYEWAIFARGRLCAITAYFNSITK